MRIFVVFIVAMSFLLANSVYALKCDKCHREEKSLDKIFEERKVKTKEDLFDKLRNGPRAKLHQHLTDEEINEAVKKMNLD